jgi:pilus assembly protein Flp/PilA
LKSAFSRKLFSALVISKGCLKKSVNRCPLSIIIECYGKIIKGRAKVFNKNSEVALRAKFAMRRSKMKMLMAYLKDESGQTSTEYILLVAVVAMIVFKFKKTAGDRLDSITNGVFGKADTMVQGIQTE